MFKPKLLQTNIFKTLDFYTYAGIPEHFLYDIVTNNRVPYKMIARFNTNYYEPRRIDEHLGVWHVHNLQSLNSYVEALGK